MKNSIVHLIAGLAFTVTTHGALPIPNYPEADLVLGQPSFVLDTPFITPTASSLSRPVSVTVDPATRKVFVSDSLDNRVLRYASADSLANGAAAEAVFGQDLFTTTLTGTAANRFKEGPEAIYFDFKGRLWVADSSASRILMFESAASRTSGASADYVFGQKNFVFSGASSGVGRMHSPNDMCVDSSDRLWVADSGNHRVLFFNNISSKLSGADADGVIGQIDFLANLPGDGSTGFASPTGVAIGPNGSIYVTCMGQSRVMRFDHAASLLPGAAASAVFGQPDFTTYGLGPISASQMRYPYASWLTADDSLWVGDRQNRVLRFSNASTKLSGAAADGVVGQLDFTTFSTALTSRGMYAEFNKPFVDGNGALWVADSTNKRVLRFSPPAAVNPPVIPPVVIPPVIIPPVVPPVVADQTAPILTLLTKAPKVTTKANLLFKGTASDVSGIKSVQYRLGRGALKPAKGTITWSFNVKLLKGKNTVTLFATDTAGNVSIAKIIKITRK
jgi:DNA-binding beta-propeller fold protein YncE